MSGSHAVPGRLAPVLLLAGAFACARGFAADAPVPAPAASTPAASASAAAVAAAPSSPPPPDIPAPLATPSAPTVPTADSVIGGEKIERVQVTDPYIELHTGPGRGYPVFFVAARGEWIAITLRHTDWYNVTTSGGKQGWVNRKQLESTLTEGGDQQKFRDIALGDYLKRTFSVGGAYGRFHGDPMDKFWAGWRFSDTLSLESTFAQVQGVFSGSTLWHVNLQAEPWSDQRISPFAGIGIGHFKNVPNRSLVTDLTTRARLSDAIVGVNYHLAQRFIIRADYTIYTAFVADARSTEYRAATLGVSVFF